MAIKGTASEGRRNTAGQGSGDVAITVITNTWKRTGTFDCTVAGNRGESAATGSRAASSGPRQS